MALYLQNLSPPTQECFVPSSVVLEKIFKFSQCIFAISFLSPLEFPSPKDALFQVWLKLVQWFSKRRWQCEKFTKRWTQTDNGQQTIKKLTHKQSLQVSLKIHLQIDLFYHLERKWEIDQRACCIFIFCKLQNSAKICLSIKSETDARFRYWRGMWDVGVNVVFHFYR